MKLDATRIYTENIWKYYKAPIPCHLPNITMGPRMGYTCEKECCDTVFGGLFLVKPTVFND